MRMHSCTLYKYIFTVPSCYVTSDCTGQPINKTVSLTECCLSFGESYDLDSRCLPCPDMGTLFGIIMYTIFWKFIILLETCCLV